MNKTNLSVKEGIVLVVYSISWVLGIGVLAYIIVTEFTFSKREHAPSAFYAGQIDWMQQTVDDDCGTHLIRVNGTVPLYLSEDMVAPLRVAFERQLPVLLTIEQRTMCPGLVLTARQLTKWPTEAAGYGDGGDQPF